MVSINDDPPPLYADDEDEQVGPLKKISATSGCTFILALAATFPQKLQIQSYS